jgi:hypothetical protein
MKKIYTLFMVSAIALTTRAQLVINENFTGYTVGNLNGQGSWASNNSSGPDVAVANTSPLIYSGYNSGGNYITVQATKGQDETKAFSQNIATGSAQTIYMSFVVNVTSSAANKQDYSIALLDNSATPVSPVQFSIKDIGGSIYFGIAGSSSAVGLTSSSYNYGTTNLIVIRYDIISSGADKGYMWVNPTSLTPEPSTSSANATFTAITETYGSSLHALQVLQTAKTPNAAFDAFRVAANANSSIAWALLSPAASSLPVTLTSFNANTDGLNNTKLAWNTSNESGIVSYVVEKSTDGRTFTDIGSVSATQQSTYSFTDNQASTDYTYYRLKIVENDGSFKYSYIVSLKSKLSLNISLSPNPVRNTLLIQHPKVGTEAHIEIINTSGQLIKDFRLPASAVLTSIDMSGLATGLYHVVFKNGTDVFSKLVLKQ